MITEITNKNTALIALHDLDSDMEEPFSRFIKLYRIIETGMLDKKSTQDKLVVIDTLNEYREKAISKTKEFMECDFDDDQDIDQMKSDISTKVEDMKAKIAETKSRFNV